MNQIKNNIFEYKKYLLIIIFSLIIALGISYAYFIGSNQNNASTNTNVTTATNERLTFTPGNDLNLMATMANFNDSTGSLSTSSTSVVSLKSNSSGDLINRYYQVYLEIQTNEFIYTTISETPELILKVTDPSGNEIDFINGLTYTSVEDYKSGDIINGFDITTFNGLLKIKENHNIKTDDNIVGISQDWTIEIIFVNLDTNQAYNANKSFVASFILQENKMSVNFDLVDNLSLMTDGELLFDNPARGFRGETFLFLGSNTAWEGEYPPAPNRVGDNIPYNILADNDPFRLLENNVLFEIDGEQKELGHMQVYFYLSDYVDKDLDQLALDQMFNYLKKVEEMGIQVLLRFAYLHSYQTDSEGELIAYPEVTAQQIVKHTEQLEEWINENIALFYKTVYGVQYGMIGIWGEFHSSLEITMTDYAEHAMVTEGVLNMFPSVYDVTVRWPTLYNNATNTQKERLTFHDDSLAGITSGVVNGMYLDVYSSEMQEIFNVTQKSFSDGETAYGWSTYSYNDGEGIDVEGFVREIAMYGFSTLSLAHNYKEYTFIDPDAGGPLTEIDDISNNVLNKATSYELTENFLMENNVPYNPAMLIDGKITAFNYLNYHLGYQLGLSNYEKDGNNVSFIINNFGINAAINQYIKITDGNTILYEGELEELNLNQFGSYKFTFDNITSSEIEIEIYNTISGENIRLANDIAYVNGIHTLPLT